QRHGPVQDHLRHPPADVGDHLRPVAAPTRRVMAEGPPFRRAFVIPRRCLTRGGPLATIRHAESTEELPALQTHVRKPSMAAQTGKRYTCPKCGSEFIVTKGGDADITCDGTPLELKK